MHHSALSKINFLQNWMRCLDFCFQPANGWALAENVFPIGDQTSTAFHSTSALNLVAIEPDTLTAILCTLNSWRDSPIRGRV